MHDTNLKENMVLCFQETHLHSPPKNKQLFSFNFAIAHSTHSILTFIEKKIPIKATKNFTKSKIELTLTDMYFHQPIA
jgi:hypothetical protein